MNTQGMAGHAVDGRPTHPLQADHPAYAFPKDANRTGEPPDHLSVQGMVNLLASDMRQLVEEIGEVRARLSPVLSDGGGDKPARLPDTPVRCRMAAEMGEIHAALQTARGLVSLTLSQLDL